MILVEPECTEHSAIFLQFSVLLGLAQLMRIIPVVWGAGAMSITPVLGLLGPSSRQKAATDQDMLQQRVAIALQLVGVLLEALLPGSPVRPLSFSTSSSIVSSAQHSFSLLFD